MKTTTKYSKSGKAVGVKKKSATMHIPATPAGSNKARIAAIGTPKKSGTKAAVVMKKGGTKKPLKKAQDGKVVRTRDENVLASMYPSINPASNAQNKSNRVGNSSYPGEYTQRYSSGPTVTKKGPFGRTIQKTSSTDTVIPESGPAFGWATTDKDVFNKKGQLIKSVRKERDINTGKLERVNKAKFDKTWTGKKGGAVKKVAAKKTMVKSKTK